MISNHQIHPSRRVSNSGYSLLELLMAVLVVGILSSLAIPAYQANIVQGRRSVAVAGLMDLANRQEQFYLNNKTYTEDLSNLGYTAGLVFELNGESAIALNNNQSEVASTSTERVYTVKIDDATSRTFSVTAVPQLAQTDDTECGSYTLTSSYAQTESGTGTVSDCW